MGREAGQSDRGGCALVTGASRGIGAAVARQLAGDGWPVAVNYRSDADAAAAVVADIEAAGGRAAAFQADVSDPEAAAGLLERVESELGGPVLVLVNNAGINRDLLTALMGDEEWDSVIATNLSGPFRLIRGALKGMRKAKFGRIVNMASIVALRANATQGNYAAAKAGLIALTRTVAVEVAKRGITVNAVAPGWIETDMTADLPKDRVSVVPAQRAGTPDEVAACVRFLASEEASYVTGTVLAVDGGFGA